ncbi:MAG: ChbG/HpnK family deacetylase [Candidatus Fimenecus sp.]
MNKNKYLIINADDFGYNEEQTKAISELYKNGLITSTSFMAVADSASEAATLAAAENITVGIHLTVNSDNAAHRWQSVSGAKSLSDGTGLYPNQSGLSMHATHRDIAAELEAQYDFAVKNGCAVDHADNHCATLYGINGRRFYRDAYAFCSRHNLPYRFPKTPYFLERQLGRKLPRAVLAFQKHLVRLGEKQGVKMPDDVVSNPYSVEKIGDYEALRRYYLDAVENCIDGVTEMFLHPAYPLENGEREWQKRVWEFELLKSGYLLEKAKEKDLQVVSWRIFENL